MFVLLAEQRGFEPLQDFSPCGFQGRSLTATWVLPQIKNRESCMHASPKSHDGFCSSEKNINYSGRSLEYVILLSFLSQTGSRPLQPGADHIIFSFLKQHMVHRIIGITPNICCLERKTGVEPASPAWKAGILAVVLLSHIKTGTTNAAPVILSNRFMPCASIVYFTT